MDKCSCIIVEFAIIFSHTPFAIFGVYFRVLLFSVDSLTVEYCIEKKMSYADIFTPTDHKQHAMRYGVVSSNQSK